MGRGKHILEAVVLALCLVAWVGAPAASASSWGALGSAHTLTSTNFGFSVGAPVNAGFICTDTAIDADVQSSTALTITSATLAGCTGTGSGGTGCSIVAAATALSWAAMAATTSGVVISGVSLDLQYQGSCAFAGATEQLTGSLNGGVWGAAGHEVVYTAAAGLTMHIAGLGSFGATVSGTLRDTAQTLTLS